MMRTIQVALVRHAATAWTAERRVHADDTAPLSTEGAAQAAAWRLPADLARLGAEGRLGWATSPFRRAMETAHHLGAAAPTVESRLRELDYGEWRGRTLEEVDALGVNLGWAGRPPGGESPAEVWRRARGWLDELAMSPGPDAWVAVTHGGVIRALVGGAMGWDLRPPAPWRLLPDRLHRLRRRRDGHLQVLTLNESLRPG
jgi:probable phosphoglycerate mutase